jgi:hypothetical protein
MSLPDDLLAAADALVGPRGRSGFLTEVISEAVQRRRLLQILSNPEAIWKDEDHPELAQGSEVWLRQLRSEDERSRGERPGSWWNPAE